MKRKNQFPHIPHVPNVDGLEFHASPNTAQIIMRTQNISPMCISVSYGLLGVPASNRALAGKAV